MDGYIAQRKDSHNEAVFKMLEDLRLKVDKLMSEAQVGKQATTYSDYKKSVSIITTAIFDHNKQTNKQAFSCIMSYLCFLILKENAPRVLRQGRRK